jgi:hypothetical protein
MNALTLARYGGRRANADALPTYPYLLLPQVGKLGAKGVRQPDGVVAEEAKPSVFDAPASSAKAPPSQRARVKGAASKGPPSLRTPAEPAADVGILALSTRGDARIEGLLAAPRAIAAEALPASGRSRSVAESARSALAGAGGPAAAEPPPAFLTVDASASTFMNVMSHDDYGAIRRGLRSYHDDRMAERARTARDDMKVEVRWPAELGRYLRLRSAADDSRHCTLRTSSSSAGEDASVSLPAAAAVGLHAAR